MGALTSLAERFAALVPAGEASRAREVAADLLRRWAEPHRCYHDSRHLTAVLDTVDELAGEARHPDTVRLAAWFHDAVHGGEAGADEAASAALAGRALRGLRLPCDVVDEVTRLVLLTATHDPAADDADGCVLTDADLAVLGGDPESYARYAADVRAEYADLPEAAFRAGRTAVLDRLLTSEALFRTVQGQRRWEARARHNIGGELLLLRASTGWRPPS